MIRRRDCVSSLVMTLLACRERSAGSRTCGGLGKRRKDSGV